MEQRERERLVCGVSQSVRLSVRSVRRMLGDGLLVLVLGQWGSGAG